MVNIVNMDEDQVFIHQVAEIIIHGLKHGQIAARKKVEEMQKEFDWNSNQMLYIAKHTADIVNNPVACELIAMILQGQNSLRKIIEEEDRKISELRRQLIEKRFDSIK